MKIDKLDIQRFSGGTFNYGYVIVNNYVGQMRDIELDDLMSDIANLTHDLEWADSGDTDWEDYKKAVNNFKIKWFKAEREPRLKEYVDLEVEKVRKELYDTIGIKED